MAFHVGIWGGHYINTSDILPLTEDGPKLFSNYKGFSGMLWP